MTRKCVWAGLPYIGGLILSGIFRSRFNWVFLLTALGMGILFFFGTKRKKETVVCTLFFFAGVICNSLYTHNVYDRLVAMDGKTVTVSGYITDFDYIGSDKFKVTVRGKVSGITTEITFFLPHDDYRYYDKISVRGKVAKLRNSISFQSEEYYYSRGIFLQGSSIEKVTWNGESANVIFRGIKEYRDSLINKIHDECGEKTGAFLAAMMCGDKSEMSQRMKTSMYRSGIGHIFAVSGTHLVVVSAMFIGMISEVIERRRTLFLLSFAEILAFTLFAGFSVSVVRAAVMLTVAQVGLIFGRKGDCLNSLGLSAMLLTVGSPYSVLSPSFALSFSAVFALGAVAPKIIGKMYFKKPVLTLGKYTVSSLCVLMVTAPVSAFFFGGLSVMSVVTNLVLVPICMLALQVSFLAVLTGGTELVCVPVLKVAEVLTGYVIKGAEIISRMSFSYVNAGNRFLISVIVITSLIALAVGLVTKKMHIFFISCAAATVLWTVMSNIAVFANKDIKVTVLPDGKNSVCIVSSGSKAILFNMGSRNNCNAAAERFICGRGINTVYAALVYDDCCYSISEYKKDLSVQPQIYFSADEINYFDNIMLFRPGDSVNIYGVEVECTDSGYTVGLGENTYYFTGNGFAVNDDYYPTDEEKFPLEINDGDTKVRRLDYGFN